MHQAYLRFFKVISLVPQGKVVSYGQVADLAGLPGRSRMVGKALREHAQREKVAWHRVVKSNGQLAALPSSEGDSEKAHIQAVLLREDGVAVNNHRVKMAEFQWQPDVYTLLHALNF